MQIAIKNPASTLPNHKEKAAISRIKIHGFLSLLKTLLWLFEKFESIEKLILLPDLKTLIFSPPGMQVYTGFWNPEMVINGVKKFGSYSGIALETQHYPDSVNRPEFPTTLLKPGENYNERTIYKFITE